MNQLTTIGIDLAKDVIAVCVMDQHGAVTEQRVLRREAFERWAAQLQPALVVMEACASSHRWGRWFAACGHTARPIAPEFVVPFHKGGKNDTADAQRAMQLTGVGPVTASALAATVPNTRVFRNGRRFGAWLGLTPRQHSSGGKIRLGRISLRGNVYLRNLLIQGARSTLQSALRADPLKASRLQRWISALYARKGDFKTVIAIANKHARMLWAMLARKENYDASAKASDVVNCIANNSMNFWCAAQYDSKTRLDRTGEEPDDSVGRHSSQQLIPGATPSRISNGALSCGSYRGPRQILGATRPFAKTQSVPLLAVVSAAVTSTNAYRDWATAVVAVPAAAGTAFISS